ncbi:MAG: hypothetical protein R3346_02160 [Candidatus Spechtbacterales bacterium]|nr:hypothetical protein [Candidatus Spechtbacterales bacterium]
MSSEMPEFGSRLKRIRAIWSLHRRGVRFVDPDNTYIDTSVTIGEGTIIYPNVYIYENSKIGKNCTIKQGSEIKDSKIGDNSEIGPYTTIEHSRIAHSVSVNHGAHLYRVVVNPFAKIAHAQIVRSFIGKRCTVLHNCYIGDARILRDCNISAGVVFCNYDGVEKQEISLEPEVFVGSGTMIIAPCSIGRSSYIAAGSIISKDVPPKSLVVARGQKHKHETPLGMLIRRHEGIEIKENSVTKDDEGWHLNK